MSQVNFMVNQRVLSFGLALILFIASTCTYAEQFNVLVFTKTQGYHHQSIIEGVEALRELSKKHYFSMDWQDDASVFNDANLSQFQAVVFLSTTGNLFNDEQKAAFQKFIRSGKGFVGIHSASDTEYQWDWYGQLVGRYFVIHPEIQTARLQVLNRQFPGVELMPDHFLWTDEWYEFGKENVKNLTTILAVDEKSYDPNTVWANKKTGSGMGKFHPIAWYHTFEGGRSFYTGLGHTAAAYKDPLFLAHVYGGIFWAATGKGLAK
jgi:uncharacterized protein